MEEEENRAREQNETTGTAENVEIPVEGVISMILFGVSMLMWWFALKEINVNHQLCTDIQGLYGLPFFDHCWQTVCLLWQASLWFKLWLVTAVASTAVCWPVGGFFSLCMCVPSFWIPAAISFWNSDELTSVSLGTWLFIIGMNICVFILWLITVSIKEYLIEKKEVLPMR